MSAPAMELIRAELKVLVLLDAREGAGAYGSGMAQWLPDCTEAIFSCSTRCNTGSCGTGREGPKRL